ncbi:MAG TPA: hypothetical protein DIW47_01980 [Bacteroidetes bacterium]|nr:hypothetical protein [Bacteroidota bacterium]
MKKLIFCFLLGIPCLLQAQTDKERLAGIKNHDKIISFCDSVLQTNYQFEIASIYLQLLYDMDSASKAEGHYNWVLKKETEPANSMFLKAKREALIGNADTALHFLNEVLATYPEHLPSLILKASILYNLRHLEELKQHVGPAFLRYPENVELQFFDAWLSFVENKVVMARLKAKKALLQTPDDNSLLQLNVLIHVALEDFNGAHLTVSKLLELDPDAYFGNFYMAGILVSLDSSSKSLYYRKRALQTNEATVYDALLMMQTWYKLEEMDSVCNLIADTEKRFPKENDTTQAGGEQWEFIEKLKRSICIQGTRRYFFQRGIAAYNLGKFDAADSLYQLAEKVEHSLCILPYFQGNRCLAQGRYEEADTFYEQAFQAMDAYRVETAELYEDAPDPNYFFAEMYLLKSARLMTSGQTNSALIAAQQAVALAKNLNADVLAGMRVQEALATLALGDISAARKLLYSIFEVSYAIEVDWCLKLCDYYECSKPNKIELKRFGLYNYYFVPTEFLSGAEVKCQRKLEGYIDDIQSKWKLAAVPLAEYDMILGLLKEVTGQSGCDHFEKAAIKWPEMNRIYLEKFGCQ